MGSNNPFLPCNQPSHYSDAGAKLEGARLAAMGYRRTSNAYCSVSRIDRPDWLYKLAENWKCAPADFYTAGTNKVTGMACDWYRCRLSADKMTVDSKVIRHVPSSGHAVTEYQPIQKLTLVSFHFRGTRLSRFVIASVYEDGHTYVDESVYREMKAEFDRMRIKDHGPRVQYVNRTIISASTSTYATEKENYTT